MSATFRARVELAAYFLAKRHGFAGCPVAYWLAAERAELALDALAAGVAATEKREARNARDRARRAAKKEMAPRIVDGVTVRPIIH